MPSLKEVKSKISGVHKTKKITRAMNMVASSKMRGAQTAMEAFRPYADKFAEVLGSLAEKAGNGEVSPLLVAREEVRKIHVILCTSDRGLCGGFNNKLMDRAKAFVKEKSTSNVEISFTNFGKKGLKWAQKQKLPVWSQYVDVVGTRIPFDVAMQAGRKLISSFMRAECDEVYVIYSEFGGMSRQVPVLQKLLPIPPLEGAKTSGSSAVESHYQAEHICEPSADELMGEMLPRNVYIQIYKALLETSTSEHAARMAAMDNATKACNDMIDALTLTYNKARQSAITAELMDIVGGAEALRG
jgi:F-type H+-transporting ATPase subunit gamma